MFLFWEELFEIDFLLALRCLELFLFVELDCFPFFYEDLILGGVYKLSWFKFLIIELVFCLFSAKKLRDCLHCCISLKFYFIFKSLDFSTLRRVRLFAILYTFSEKPSTKSLNSVYPLFSSATLFLSLNLKAWESIKLSFIYSLITLSLTPCLS